MPSLSPENKIPCFWICQKVPCLPLKSIFPNCKQIVILCSKQLNQVTSFVISQKYVTLSSNIMYLKYSCYIDCGFIWLDTLDATNLHLMPIVYLFPILVALSVFGVRMWCCRFFIQTCAHAIVPRILFPPPWSFSWDVVYSPRSDAPDLDSVRNWRLYLSDSTP
jgi:hypothetical protein